MKRKLFIRLTLLAALGAGIVGSASLRPRGPRKPYQFGNAVWYGPRFHGRLTASGETFNMHAMTAAHRQLPLGSVVEVTNLRNGRKVQVRINDRGPWGRAERIIDLSYAASRHLDMTRAGVVQVRLETMASL